MKEKANDPWGVLHYEVKMYGLSRRQIAARGYPSTDEELVLKNALVESALLHTRILVEIMLSSGRGNDDVRLQHLISETDVSDTLSNVLVEMKTAWGDSRTKGSPCWTINKMLAHPTLWRSSSYDYGTVANTIDPHIYSAVRELAVIAGRPDILEFL